MSRAGEADVLIVASTVAFQAVPYISTYAATKVFDLFLAEGLAEEMRPHGIRVCALLPGTTASEISCRCRPSRSHNTPAAKPLKSCPTGLRALASGKSLCHLRSRHYLGAQSQRLVPRRVVPAIAANMLRPSSERAFPGPGTFPPPRGKSTYVSSQNV